MKTGPVKTAPPLLALSAALALLLAGCGDKPAEADKNGGISVEDPVAEMKAEAVKMRPGQYRTEIRIETLEMPQAEGMPPEMMGNFKASMQAAMQPTESCLTPEMADRGAEQVISQGQQNCRFERLEMDGGKFDAAMVCTPEQGGEVRSTVVGTMTDTRSEFRTTSEVKNPQMPGTMKMVLGFVTERIGDCPDEAPVAGMAMVSPSVSTSDVAARSRLQELWGSPNVPRVKISSLSAEQRAELEEMLNQEVQKYIENIPRVEGQGRTVRVRVTLDPQKSMVIADFSRNFLPKAMGAAWEDQAQLIDNSIYALIGDKIEYGGMQYLVDGLDVIEYFPEEKILAKTGFSAKQEITPTVALSAGHGIY